MSSQIIIEEWRDLWSYKSDFMVVACAFVFSAGNMLRLPWLVVNQGGCEWIVFVAVFTVSFAVAFIAAYVAVLFAAVLPIIIMEMTVGQITGRAPPQGMLSVCPLFKGCFLCANGTLKSLVKVSALRIFSTHSFSLAIWACGCRTSVSMATRTSIR